MQAIVYCCWFNNLNLQIRVSCHNRPPTEWNSKHTRDHSGSITYSFKCGLRGFHVYKEVWSPIVGEQLKFKCCHERNNCYDRYAIAATKRLRGRLADSCPEKFPEQHAFSTFSYSACAKVIDKNHRRSPLVQGGLEIPVQVTTEMDLERNKAILEKYKQIVVSNYKEPGMDGNFDDCTKEVLKELEDDDSDADEEVQSNTDCEILLLNCFLHLFFFITVFFTHYTFT